VSAVAGLLAQVRALGVTVRVSGDNLALRPISAVPDGLKAALRAAKPELLALLRAEAAADVRPCAFCGSDRAWFGYGPPLLREAIWACRDHRGLAESLGCGGNGLEWHQMLRGPGGRRNAVRRTCAGDEAAYG
jgi:hypothetical protein